MIREFFPSSSRTIVVAKSYENSDAERRTLKKKK